MKRRPGLGAAILCALPAAVAHGQGVTSLNRTGSGARAAGMANAFVAVSDDGTAASWNPAGLAQLRLPELSLVLSAVDRHFDQEGFRSSDGRWVYSPRRFGFTTSSPEFASLAVPFGVAGKPVTVQLGWRRLYKLDSQADVAFRREPARGAAETVAFLRLDSDSAGNVDIWSLAGAVRLTERMSLGVSGDFWFGDWTEEFTAIEAAADGTLPDFVAFSRSHRIRGQNLNAGLMLTYPRWKVGLVYHQPFWSDYEQHSVQESNLVPRAEASSDGARFRFPRSWGVGLAWRPATRWTVAADVTSDQWSDFLVEGLGDGQTEPLNFLDELPADRTSVRDTVSFNAGVERLLQGQGFVVPVRVGLAWEPQGYMDPLLRDPVDYWMLAAGAGYNTNSFKFDLAFQLRGAHYGGTDFTEVRRRVLTDEGPDAVGTVSAREWRVKLSGIYRVTDTGKLRGILRKIFVGP